MQTQGSQTICSCNRLLFFKITNRLCGRPHTHKIKKTKKQKQKTNKTKQNKRKEKEEEKKSGYEKLA